MIAEMIAQGFQLKVKIYAAGFLEVDLGRQDDGSIDLKQNRLIYHIAYIVGFKNMNPNNKLSKI